MFHFEWRIYAEGDYQSVTAPVVINWLLSSIRHRLDIRSDEFVNSTTDDFSIKQSEAILGRIYKPSGANFVAFFLNEPYTLTGEAQIFFKNNLLITIRRINE